MKDPTCRGQKMEVAEPDMQVWKDCLKEIAPEINTEDDQAKIEKKIPKEKMAVSQNSTQFFAFYK